jgi:hypothetical protein
MNKVKGVAVLLIAAGVFGLTYGGFTYTKETHEAEFGPLSLTMKDQRRVTVPVWAGVGAIVIGTGLLLLPPKR